MKAITSVILTVCLLSGMAAQGQTSMQKKLCEPTWESLNTRGYPRWFSDAKLGIFIHWGLYSVPAYASKEGYGEWFYRGLMTGDSSRCAIMRYYADSTLPVFEQYKTLTQLWKAELWDPDQWASLFYDAGAQYVMLVTKHHDGYCLWDSPLQPMWNSVTSGPRRNIVEELTKSVRNLGLHMCFYYSLPEWTNPLHIWMEDPDDSIANYVEHYMIPQFKELVMRYRPDAVFADGDWSNSPEQFHSQELISWYYNTVGGDAIVNNRWGAGTQHGFITPEYSAGIDMKDRPWAECRGLGRSFGLNRNEDLDNYLSSTELIQHFALLVSEGGGMTLNVGPAADGTIPLIQQERLRELGRWLQVNRQAIYGSKAKGAYYSRKVIDGIDEIIDFDWVRNAPRKGMTYDHFDIQWTGYPKVDAPGRYTIEIEADDEMVVQVGNEILIHYVKDDPEHQSRTATIDITANEIDRPTLLWTISFKEKDLEAVARLHWHRDKEEDQPIKAIHFNHGKRQSGWMAKYSCEKMPQYCCTEREGTTYAIVFQRPRNNVKLVGFEKLKRGSTIRLLGTEGHIRWKQAKDGTLTIDISEIDDNELNALNHAWVFSIN